jgi:uncharacterized 2Fe-2S/4Fe-4S cluster protein (DUF4445 family)
MTSMRRDGSLPVGAAISGNDAGAREEMAVPQAPDRVQIVFTPSGRRDLVAPGATVLEVARSLGVDLDSVCGGRGICGRCQIIAVEGEFPKHGLVSTSSSLASLTEDERRFRKKRGLAPDRRLGCQAQIRQEVVIDVPPESQLHRQVVRKRVEVRDLTIDPVIRLYYVTVAGATLEAANGTVQRLLKALADRWELTGVSVDARIIGSTQTALISGEGAVTVAVRDGDSIVAVWPGLRDSALGIAFDVGSTTIAGYLCNLMTGETLATAGRMNPQIRFGEDLMSRVSHVMLNADGAKQLVLGVRLALDDLVGELVADAGSNRDDVLEFTLVGNPIMHHLVFGYDVRPLGRAPFELATTDPIDLDASSLGISAHPMARLHALPCIAGHVGSDAAAAILSEAPHQSVDVQLVVDVGTNAEIVIGSKDRIVAASSPTGPAFEGAQISSGQRAAPGAVERVRIDRETLEPRFKVVGCDQWCDEDGFEDAVAEFGVSGICGSGIIEAIAELYLAGVVMPDGRFAESAAARSDRIVVDDRSIAYRLTDSISVTQLDVRAVQLAKAALSAGVSLLMDHLEIDQVDQIRLAGAFGSHIDAFYAMVLGLIPDCDLDRVSAAGNAAGAGAIIALLDRSSRAEIGDVVRTVEKIETAVEPRFQEYFVEAMAFPHETAPYHLLSSVVQLPRTGDSPTAERRQRGKPEDPT